MGGGIERRLARLTAKAQPSESLEDEYEREKRRELTRQGAEQINDQRRREGMEPAFEITEDGDVLCIHDGRPFRSFHQTLAEDWYHLQLASREAGIEDGFTHAPEAEAFYGAAGEIALSREACHLEKFFRYLA
jgi:hypothetical protein